MLGTNISTLSILKINLSDHPFIKYDIFEVHNNSPSRGNTIDIVAQYCEHHNMPYISQLTNNSSLNHAFPTRNRTTVWILSIGIKKPTTVKQVLEDISIQKLAGKCNRDHVITYTRDKIISRINIQLNRSMLNQISNIQTIGNKRISLLKKPLTKYHIGDVVKSPHISACYDSIFSNHEKMAKSTTFSAPFLRSSLPPDKKFSDLGFILG